MKIFDYAFDGTIVARYIISQINKLLDVFSLTYLSEILSIKLNQQKSFYSILRDIFIFKRDRTFHVPLAEFFFIKWNAWLFFDFADTV